MKAAKAAKAAKRNRQGRRRSAACPEFASPGLVCHALRRTRPARQQSQAGTPTDSVLKKGKNAGVFLYTCGAAQHQESTAGRSTALERRWTIIRPRRCFSRQKMPLAQPGRALAAMNFDVPHPLCNAQAKAGVAALTLARTQHTAHSTQHAACRSANRPTGQWPAFRLVGPPPWCPPPPQSRSAKRRSGASGANSPALRVCMAVTDARTCRLLQMAPCSQPIWRRLSSTEWSRA